MDIHWELSARDLKQYPHFDAPLSVKKANKIVRSPEKVAQNKFFPFLLYYDEWQPYRLKDDGRPNRKTREIRYAARRDAYIYSYYRSILAAKYERLLSDLGIADCPIAYRKLIIPGTEDKGKCNIDFAKDAFDHIEKMGDCIAIALDIEKYFDRLDHGRIHEIWCKLLGVSKLPDDHQAVFRNITKFRYVDQKEAYRRLGFIVPKSHGTHDIEGYRLSYKDMPKQLCSPSEFRNKICGKDPKYPSIIHKNDNDFGIPQGAPISDLIANFYLVYFDKEMSDFASSRGGTYMRYSDDIVLVLPCGKDVADEAKALVSRQISNCGKHLKIKESKTCVVEFSKTKDRLEYRHIEGPQGKNGFEYLGFRFDGRKVYVRESTISRFYRKIASAARREAYRHVERNRGKKFQELVESFPFATFKENFGRVRNFEEYADEYRKWTFWTYIKRAERKFGVLGDRILRQVASSTDFMQIRVSEAILSALDKQPGAPK